MSIHPMDDKTGFEATDEEMGLKTPERDPLAGFTDLRIDWATYGGPYLRLPSYVCGGTVGYTVAKLSFADPTPFEQKKLVATYIVDACRLYAVHSEMLHALRLHKAWVDSESAGPDYGGQTRDTHPDGEKIWRAWWDNQLDLCDRANEATNAVISKANGGLS